MSWTSNEVVAVLTFLLPGFVAAAVFYSLTSHPKPSKFERVVQALIFTIVVEAVARSFFLVSGTFWTKPLWTEDWAIVFSVLIAVAVALISVYVSNNDTLHGLLRRIGFTQETSHASEWYSAFSRNHDCYVVLHLTGARRLYGWPEEWPSNPDRGHFRIVEAEWLTEDGRTPLTGVTAIVVPATDVEMVEFLSIKPAEESAE